MADDRNTGEITGEIHIQLRNSLLNLERQLECYLSDEMLESTVSRLQQICRHLLVFAGTNSALNDVIESIGLVLYRLTLCENTLCSGRNHTPLHYSGHKGRPKFEIGHKQLEYLVFYDLSVQDIANAFSVSKSTIQHRFSEYGIYIKSATSFKTDEQLDDLVRRIKQDFPNAGYQRVGSHLRNQGVKVPQSRVREAMQRVDPEGVALRWLSLTPRCTYSVPGPLWLWHIHGNHKLIRYICRL